MASKEDIQAGLTELMVEVANAREKLLQGELLVIEAQSTSTKGP